MGLSLDYIVLLLAVVCFAGQFAFTKLFEARVNQTVTSALVMLVFTNLVGAALYLFIGGFRVSFSAVSFFWAILFALVMIPYYIVGIKVLSLGSLALYSMFMMLGGMLVPFLYGIIWLNEKPSVFQIAGSVLLTAFIVLQAVSKGDAGREEGGGKKGKKALFFLLCLVIFFANGMTGVIAKAHQISIGAVDEVSFTVIACLLTALFSLLLLLASLIRKKEGITQARLTLRPAPLGIMTLLGGAAYTGNFLLLKAATNIPASIQFPIVSGGVIVLSALVSALVFRERLAAKEWVSVVGAFVATVLFAF